MSDDAVDYKEVGRMAHELAGRHGPLALQFAQKRSEQTLAAGEHVEHKFWKAVAASLTPR